MEDRELLERIDHTTIRNAELTDAILVILREILVVLRGSQDHLGGISEHLEELRNLGQSHQQALLRILDRLGPAPGAG